MITLILIIATIAAILQAIFSSYQNKGENYYIPIFLLGIGVYVLWILLMKYSHNIVRDSLIWDIIMAMCFSVVFIFMGHAEHFALRHWIGFGLASITFLYWAIVDYGVFANVARILGY